MKGFRDWVLHDTPYLIPGEDALPALEVIEAIYQSAKLGRKVEIKRKD
jgi:predicted dehydrogenase